jgi:hypothetical protein
VADRIWANIGRVTGVIAERNRDCLVVDPGKGMAPQVITIPDRAASRILVRFPRLEPGYLIDVIGSRRGGAVEGLIPATSQPAYRSDQVPRLPRVTGRPLAPLSGSATWHEPAGQPDDAEGIGYPLLDPEAAGAQEAARGCRRMPYLCVGSLLEVRNECAATSLVLPVTGYSPAARLFCDRCVTCGTSARGRVADLTLASFAALGGDLERGCFNATITVCR